ncbi:MAG: hypothetical protein ABSG53_00455 [Thermoguttaceae bacterium]|jgi:hypothetical protein
MNENESELVQNDREDETELIQNQAEVMVGLRSLRDLDPPFGRIPPCFT